jgi:hypothetical protein
VTPELLLALILRLPLALTLGLPLGLTPGLPLGLQPYNPFVLGPGPKARVATSTLGLPIYLNNLPSYLPIPMYLPTLTTYLLTYLFTYPTLFSYLPCFVQSNNESSFNLKIII